MSRASRYEGILFDVGGTLLDVFRDPQQAACDAIRHIGEISLDDYRAGIRRSLEEWRDAGGLPQHEDLAETWVRHNQRSLELAGFTGDAATAAHLMETSFLSGGWRLYAEVDSTLTRFQTKNIPMGVVSNWPATLELTLRKLGIRDFFSVIVSSGEVGYAKPHPAIFRLAAERLGISPARILYVGDSLDHDVAGALGAGMNAVLVDRHDAHPSHTPRIRALGGLEELVLG